MPQVLEKSHLKKRTRLAPEVRKQLILDAALTEFSERGYDGASTTLIAKRAGLAQAGIYAHFKSKEDILGALLFEVLMPRWAPWLDPERPLDEKALDQWIDNTHDSIADPKFQAVIRILISDGFRFPKMIKEWHKNVIRPYFAAQQQAADKLVSEEKRQSNVLTDVFLMAISPVVHVLMMHLVLGTEEDGAKEEIQTLREAHRRMFKELIGSRLANNGSANDSNGGNT